MNFQKNVTWIKINKTKNNLDIHLILSQIRRKCMKMKKDNKILKDNLNDNIKFIC